MSKKPNKAQKTKKGFVDVLLTMVLILAIGVFCYAGYNLFKIFLEYKKGSDEYSKIAKMAVEEREADKDSGERKKASEVKPEDLAKKAGTLTPPMKVDFGSLKEVNKDVNGWIYVEAIPEISYPVVHGVDNSYYLTHTYEDAYNIAGTIFVDYENKSDFTDCNTLVYGHNMKNGTMFAQLKKFTTDGDIYRKSPYFWMFTPEASYRYEIVSAYTTGVNEETYMLFKGPGEEFLEWEKRMTGLSQIPEQPPIDTDAFIPEDKIITLSTCTGDYSTRYVVQGRRVNTVKNEGAVSNDEAVKNEKTTADEKAVNNEEAAKHSGE